MSYRCKHFTIEELVSPIVFNDRGEQAWDLLDPRLLQMLDQLVDRFGAIIVNTWKSGGKFDLRGYRGRRDLPKDHFIRGRGKDTYSLDYDQHIHGRAADCTPLNTTVHKIRDYILNHQDEFPLIGGIELDVSWLHIDVRPRRNGKIVAFKP